MSKKTPKTPKLGVLKPIKLEVPEKPYWVDASLWNTMSDEEKVDLCQKQ